MTAHDPECKAPHAESIGGMGIRWVTCQAMTPGVIEFLSVSKEETATK